MSICVEIFGQCSIMMPCRRLPAVRIVAEAVWEKEMEDGEMVIAVTYENGQVFQHFGHSEHFKIYEIENGKIVKSEVCGTDGQGHGALAGLLHSYKVDALICGGIGGGARGALSEMGIRLYPGVSGNADEAVEALLGGTLSYDPDTMCSHHGDGHGCGSHGQDCSGHSCGNH